MKKNPVLILLFVASILLLSSCTNSLKTTSYATISNKIQKAYIFSKNESEFINFKMGIPLGYVYVVPTDDAPVTKEKIGNTDSVIMRELSKYSINAQIVQSGDTIKEADLLVFYNDVWRWDFKKILDNLEIVFYMREKERPIVSSSFSIGANKELHNFPTPEKVVPKMIRQMIEKCYQP